MSQDIFIGIDGGGTKTKVRIEDGAGKLLGRATAGPANIRLSVEEAWRSIYSAIEEVIKPLGITLNAKTQRFHAGLGLAGSEVVAAQQAFMQSPHPFTTMQLVSDAHIACLGAHQGADGAIIIAGTGTIGYQIENGKGSRVSGWGFPHDDEGSGAWLGLEATRLTFQWLDQRIEKSPLVEDIFSYFKQDKAQFVAWANRATSSEFARLAPIVIQHSQQEETVAVHLMKKAAQAIDRIEQALTKMRIDKKLLPCCLLGGIAPFLEPWLDTNLRASFVPQQADAVAGALLMIRQYVG